MDHIVLIGRSLKHSVSPVFQQAALDHLGIRARYELRETAPEEVADTVKSLTRPGWLGANITIPYKEAVLPLMDDLDRDAARIGAVNTIVNREGRLTGYNTDGAGFLRALYQDGTFVPRGKNAVLLGAGGAARSVAFTLIDSGVKALALVSRTQERGEALAAGLATPGAQISVSPWTERDIASVLSDCDLIVNCTPVGLRGGATEGQTPLKAAQIPKKALVYDLVYNPIETPLIREAKSVGAPTLGGLPMLVYQGAISLELWTGASAPVDLMLASALEALERSAEGEDTQ